MLYITDFEDLTKSYTNYITHPVKSVTNEKIISDYLIEFEHETITKIDLGNRIITYSNERKSKIDALKAIDSYKNNEYDEISQLMDAFESSQIMSAALTVRNNEDPDYVPPPECEQDFYYYTGLESYSKRFKEYLEKYVIIKNSDDYYDKMERTMGETVYIINSEGNSPSTAYNFLRYLKSNYVNNQIGFQKFSRRDNNDEDYNDKNFYSKYKCDCEGYNIDEFPPNTFNENYRTVNSVKLLCVPISENSSEGGKLAAFYNAKGAFKYKYPKIESLLENNIFGVKKLEFGSLDYSLVMPEIRASSPITPHSNFIVLVNMKGLGGNTNTFNPS